MEIGLRSGGCDIIAHGETFLFGMNQDLVIDVRVQEDFLFSVTLRFETDSSGEQRIKPDASENEIVVSCMNFSDEGSGLLEPVKIAEVEGKALYLMFWSFVYGSGRKVRGVRYTLFYEREVDGEAG